MANDAMPREHRGLRRLVRHDDRAGGGEHAVDAVADRDLGAGDLHGGGAAHLAHTLLQGVHAVHPGMHVGEAAAIGVERQFAVHAREIYLLLCVAVLFVIFQTPLILTRLWKSIHP
jgi:hypothetical protein